MNPEIDYYDNAEGWKPTATTTLPDLIDAIKSDEYAAKVSEVRRLLADGEKPAADTLKKTLPAVSLSGVVTGRRAKAVDDGRFTHTGLLQIDLDGKDNVGWTVDEMRDILQAEPRIVATFISPSGDGVKGVARIPADVSTHMAAFLAAEAHFRSLNLNIDPSCKDPVRLCFVSHDPDAQIGDLEGPVFEPQDAAPKPGKPPTSTGLTLSERFTKHDWSLSDLAELIAPIPRPPYAEWLKTCSGAWNHFGESATAVLSARWPEEAPGEYAEKFQHRTKDHSFGTVVHFAKENGWRGKNQVAQAATATAAQKTPPPFFYDGAKYFLDHESDFIPMDCRSVSRHLLARRVPKEMIEGTLCTIQTRGFIHYAGPLAGYPRGVHETGGKRLLATSSPTIIQPRKGSWDTIRALLDGLLGETQHGGEQFNTVLGFWKYGIESVRSGKPRPCWALALAGPVGCGKSLLIDLTERMLGGRRANPYAYFTGKTNFNADLAGAELLAVDDEAGSFDIRTRKHLGAAIKNNLFAGSVRIEGKHRMAFSFRPVWRMMLALNDEPESLLALPPLTEDIADKISIVRCHKRPLPMPAHTLDEREAFFAQLVSELPALGYDLECWQPEPEDADERCGIRAFQHPALLAAMDSLAPEQSLANLIDACADAGGIALPWEGSAASLRALLDQCQQTSKPAADLLDHWQPACGAYLGKLAKPGGRVSKATTVRGLQRWLVHPEGWSG